MDEPPVTAPMARHGVCFIPVMRYLILIGVLALTGCGKDMSSDLYRGDLSENENGTLVAEPYDSAHVTADLSLDQGKLTGTWYADTGFGGTVVARGSFEAEVDGQSVRSARLESDGCKATGQGTLSERGVLSISLTGSGACASTRLMLVLYRQ